MERIWMKALWPACVLLAGCAHLQPKDPYNVRALGPRMCVISSYPVDVYALGTTPGQVIHVGPGKRVRFRWPWTYDTGTIRATAGDSVVTISFEPWTSRRWTWYLDSGLVQRNC